MQTKARTGGPPALTTIYLGEGTTMSSEIDFRMRRLEAEASAERLVGHRHGLRQAFGHAVMALGRAIHGIEPEPACRPALHAR